jgi:DNA-binding response OmpR family regulator
MGRRNLPASAPRVLVADPDPEARLRVQQALCRTCLVDVAGTAADARRLVAEGDYDGLVIDVEAVEADLDVLARFRSGDGSGGKGGPAVALAGGSPTEARERLLEAGYDACMTGSLDARRLQALMRDAGTRDAGTRDAGTRDAGPDSGARARVHDTERPNALRSARREA